MMDHGGFLISGSRPPSVTSTHRPSSASNRHHGYHIVARTSIVDESLFGSANPTKLDQPLGSFKAPWEYPKPIQPGHMFAVTKTKSSLCKDKERMRGRPLLWSPMPGTSVNVKAKININSSTHDPNVFWNTRDHFRNFKHTPTYVDESLFGRKLEDPKFKAPWNVRKNNEAKKPTKPQLWDPSEDSKIQLHNGFEIDINYDAPAVQKRPKTALGIGRSKLKSSSTSNPLPVWKP